MIGVLGATGHIGNTLVRKLAEKKEKIRAIIPEGEDLAPLIDTETEMQYADLRDYDSLSKAIKGCTRIFHLAGIISIKSSEWQKLYEVNVLGTRNVVRASLENGIGRLVYTSSIHALKEPPRGTTIDEAKTFEPQYGDYAKSKALASIEVLEGVKKGLDAVIVCPTGVIGPYDFKISEMGTLILKYAKSKTVFYIDGAYDFIDVRDVADGHILAMEEGKKGEVYILSGEKVTVSEIFSILEEVTTQKKTKLKIPLSIARFASIFTPFASLITGEKPIFTDYSISVLQSNSDVSSKKARENLKFNSRPIRESIKDSYEWFKKEGYI